MHRAPGNQWLLMVAAISALCAAVLGCSSASQTGDEPSFSFADHRTSPSEARSFIALQPFDQVSMTRPAEVILREPVDGEAARLFSYHASMREGSRELTLELSIELNQRVAGEMQLGVDGPARLRLIERTRFTERDAPSPIEQVATGGVATLVTEGSQVRVEVSNMELSRPTPDAAAPISDASRGRLTADVEYRCMVLNDPPGGVAGDEGMAATPVPRWVPDPNWESEFCRNHESNPN